MDAAAKAAQEEARNKTKNNKKSDRNVEPATTEEQNKEAEQTRTPGLFDQPAEPQLAPKPAMVAPVTAPATLASAAEAVSASASDEEGEILAKIAEETSEAGADDVAG